MRPSVDFAVIGGGILGLASARALQRRFPGRSLVLLEKESRLATHQTGHNSGVIHSGLYYRPGSFKARLGVEGARRMVEFCRERGIAHEICGKVVVATEPGELPRLEELERRGKANGIGAALRIGPERLREIEPHAAGIAALHVPSTGIVDYCAVAEAMRADIAAAGGEVRTSSPVIGARILASEAVLETPAGALHARHVVNCAGLHSDRVARALGASPGLRIVPFRGEYFRLRRERQDLVRALIYPVPDPAFPFLGVHFTRMIRGGVEAGPNAVLALRREGYRKSDLSLLDVAEMFRYRGFLRMARTHWRTGFSEMRRSFDKGVFAASLRRLVPEVEASDLEPGGAGVRAQAVLPDGRLLDDFCFLPHGRALHVLNAPSPAATASLAIGDAVADEVARVFSLV